VTQPRRRHSRHTCYLRSRGCCRSRLVPRRRDLGQLLRHGGSGPRGREGAIGRGRESPERRHSMATSEHLDGGVESFSTFTSKKTTKRTGSRRNRGQRINGKDWKLSRRDVQVSSPVESQMFHSKAQTMPSSRSARSHQKSGPEKKVVFVGGDTCGCGVKHLERCGVHGPRAHKNGDIG